MFQISISTESPAFRGKPLGPAGECPLDPRGHEVRRILSIVRDQLAMGYCKAPIYDVDGNHAGQWAYGPEESPRAAATRIVDLFDALLEDHQVVLDDEDRAQDENACAIYGTTYANLVDAVEEILNSNQPCPTICGENLFAYILCHQWETGEESGCEIVDIRLDCDVVRCEMRRLSADQKKQLETTCDTPPWQSDYEITDPDQIQFGYLDNQLLSCYWNWRIVRRTLA